MFCFSQWAYNEFIGITPNIKAANNQEFIITMKKGAKKTESMRFSTDHRADLLTEALVRVRDENRKNDGEDGEKERETETDR